MPLSAPQAKKALQPTMIRFKGAIDEVRAYNRALSGSEIADIYTFPTQLRLRFP